MFKKIFILIVLSFCCIEFTFADFNVKARSAILQDYHSGEILYEKDADKSIYPASMTKIMTAIIAFDLIKSGDIKLDENLSFQKKHGGFLPQDILQCLLW